MRRVYKTLSDLVGLVFIVPHAILVCLLMYKWLETMALFCVGAGETLDVLWEMRDYLL